MCLFLWITLSRQRDKFSARSARDVNVVRNPFTRQKRSLKKWKQQRGGKKEATMEGKGEKIQGKHNPSVYFMLPLQGVGLFFFSICQLWLDQTPRGSRCLLRRGPQAAHTDSIFIQHCNNMSQKGEAAAVLQPSANAELIMGGGMKKKKRQTALQSWEEDFEE